ncbi:PIN domain nuclease [bacterium]|nr:PIN domain nuclease [bacterium]
MIIVDSSVWIDFFNGASTRESDHLDLILRTEMVGMGDLILVETLQGFRSDQDYKIAEKVLRPLPVFDLLGPKRALKSVENYRMLRHRGITIRKTDDVIIASFCIDERYPLLFSDRDFDPFVQHLGLTSALPN